MSSRRLDRISYTWEAEQKLRDWNAIAAQPSQEAQIDRDVRAMSNDPTNYGPNTIHAPAFPAIDGLDCRPEFANDMTELPDAGSQDHELDSDTQAELLREALDELCDDPLQPPALAAFFDANKKSEEPHTMIQIDEHTQLRQDDANAAGINAGTSVEPLAFGRTYAHTYNATTVKHARAAGVHVAIIRGRQNGHPGYIAVAPKL